MTLRSEPVERSTHIQLLLGCHVKERQINGRTTCVAALLVDVFLLKQHALVKVGIEVCLHQRVGHVLCPAHKVVNTHLWAIGIVNLKSIALRFYIVAHSPQCLSSLLGEQCRGLQIAVDTSAHKVVCTEVSYLKYGVGHSVGQGHKLACVVGCANLGLLLCKACRKHTCAAYQGGGYHPMNHFLHSSIYFLLNTVWLPVHR